MKCCLTCLNTCIFSEVLCYVQFVLKDSKCTVADRNKTEYKTQNRIAKFKTESQNPKTESQNPKQNRKIRNRITKLKTESQNPKQNKKTQNRMAKPKTK